MKKARKLIKNVGRPPKASRKAGSLHPVPLCGCDVSSDAVPLQSLWFRRRSSSPGTLWITHRWLVMNCHSQVAHNARTQGSPTPTTVPLRNGQPLFPLRGSAKGITLVSIPQIWIYDPAPSGLLQIAASPGAPLQEASRRVKLQTGSLRTRAKQRSNWGTTTAEQPDLWPARRHFQSLQDL